MFNTEFEKFTINQNTKLDLYPESLRNQIDEANEWIYPTINNGVYSCGFAKTQFAYDEAIQTLFNGLDRLEDILSKSRYVVGSSLTEADIRLFQTLVRFDEVYVVYFKCNVKRIKDYPNIHNYCREIFQLPGVKESINMDHIKAHYFTSHPDLNKFAIIPKGPNAILEFSEPHNRDSL